MIKKYGVNEIRAMFLDFFKSKEHLVLKSFSLVPHNDNSLLLINSGMAPLKPYFTGQEIPPSKRVATCQKCIRTGDIENVGKTARHGTFFEMLGNFSFGDYFKHEAIKWTWEFLTEVVKLDPNRLYPSVYEEDDEAFEIWNKEIGIPVDRIYRFGKADNFWEHGAGPCGPSSEVYYDRGERFGTGPDAVVGGESDRYMEVWNNVFTQFDSDGKGIYTELENKNIDTGMGLERLAVALQDVDSIFEIDTIRELLDEVAKVAGIKYKDDEIKDISLRLITDHIRSCTFMISDGIMPSNEGRGYVLRRLLRRAARHGRMLGIQDKFLANLAKTVIKLSKDAYIELEEKSAMILKVLTEEEDKFYKTIDQGLNILSDIFESMKKENRNIINGEEAFKLYDTYGFPLDLTKEIALEKGYSIDEQGFNLAMKEQKDKARKARKTTNYMGADITVYESLDTALTTEFIGYKATKGSGKVIALTTETQVVETLKEEEYGSIITDKTVFYATMGGQSADVGYIRSAESLFEVEDVVKLKGDKVAHIGKVVAGSFSLGNTVDFEVDESIRANTMSNHSGTHLLHKALREVLGTHVEQAGSLVSSDRLRFDFTHFSALTKEEISKIENLVREEIKKGNEVVTEIMNIEDAKKAGAMALFGEKYANDVRVVSMGDFSKELCGGIHVSNTANIKAFKIISESGIAAGVRRIEALTGDSLLAHYEEIEKDYNEIASLLKTNSVDVKFKLKTLMDELKEIKSENDKLKAKLASNSVSDIENEIFEVSGIKILVTKLENIEMNELRTLSDNLKAKLVDTVIVLISKVADKVNLLVVASDSAISKGINAGNIIKVVAPIVGGGGGGRPNMAQAGGKDITKIDEALAKAKDIIEETL